MGPAEPITINYDRYTAAERREAEQALAHPYWPVGRPLRVGSPVATAIGWAVFAAAVAACYVLTPHWPPWDAVRWLYRHPGWVAAAVAVALAGVALHAWAERARDRLCRAAGTRYALDETGLATITVHGRTDTPWSAVSAWVETEHLLLVRHRGLTAGRATCLFFPKRLFVSPDEVARACRLLAEHVRGPVG